MRCRRCPVILPHALHNVVTSEETPASRMFPTCGLVLSSGSREHPTSEGRRHGRNRPRQSHPVPGNRTLAEDRRHHRTNVAGLHRRRTRPRRARDRKSHQRPGRGRSARSRWRRLRLAERSREGCATLGVAGLLTFYAVTPSTKISFLFSAYCRTLSASAYSFDWYHSRARAMVGNSTMMIVFGVQSPSTVS